MSKQNRRSFLTRRLLVFLHWNVGEDHEPIETDLLAASPPPTSTQGGDRCPPLSQDPGCAGTRPRAIRRRHRRHARGDQAERLQLGHRLRPRPRPIGLGRSGPLRTSTAPDRGHRGLASVPARLLPPALRPPGHDLDGTPAPTRSRAKYGSLALGRHDPARAGATRLRVEATALRLGPRPRAREKNDGSGGKSWPCRAAASCWPRTRPTSCCSRP